MSDPIGLTAFATHDHRQCDLLWAEVEAAEGDTSAALKAWQRFTEAMERHFQMEEQVLFPAFEEATGMHGHGPTVVMRMEHQQMRGVLATMEEAAAAEDLDLLLDHGDTLLMLIQQHNAKEEGMLYPMSERSVGADWPALHAEITQRFYT